jgi:tRNA A37 threonylcarbamoyladenosine modification protein TsaB
VSVYLGLKTVGEVAEVLLVSGEDGAIISRSLWPADLTLSETILEKVEAIVSSVAGFGALSGIIFCNEPGSFTALRIGASVVNCLADQLGVPLVGVMTREIRQSRIMGSVFLVGL